MTPFFSPPLTHGAPTSSGDVAPSGLYSYTQRFFESSTHLGISPRRWDGNSAILSRSIFLSLSLHILYLYLFRFRNHRAFVFLYFSPSSWCVRHYMLKSIKLYFDSNNFNLFHWWWVSFSIEEKVLELVVHEIRYLVQLQVLPIFVQVLFLYVVSYNVVLEHAA